MQFSFVFNCLFCVPCEFLKLYMLFIKRFYFPNIFVQRTPDFSVEYSTWTGINREQFGALVLEKLAILINNSIHFKFHSLLKIIFMIKIIHHTRNNYFHSQNSHFFILNLLVMLSLLLKHTILLTILQSH